MILKLQSQDSCCFSGLVLLNPFHIMKGQKELTLGELQHRRTWMWCSSSDTALVGKLQHRRTQQVLKTAGKAVQIKLSWRAALVSAIDLFCEHQVDLLSDKE